MPSAQIYLDQEEDIKVEKYSKKWKIAKYETVRRMIREFKEERGNN